MYDPGNFYQPGPADSHPRVIKADIERREELARKNYQSRGLLWELGYLLSLPVRAPVSLWGKVRRKR